MTKKPETQVGAEEVHAPMRAMIPHNLAARAEAAGIDWGQIKNIVGPLLIAVVEAWLSAKGEQKA